MSLSIMVYDIFYLSYLYKEFTIQYSYDQASIWSPRLPPPANKDHLTINPASTVSKTKPKK